MKTCRLPGRLQPPDGSKVDDIDRLVWLIACELRFAGVWMSQD